VGGGFSAYAEDGRIANIGQDGLFDFAQGLTIDVGDVTGGVTTAAIEMRVFSSLDSSWAEVEFPWPNSEAEFYNNENHYGESIALFNGFTPSWNAGKATTLFYHLEPRSANMSVLGKFDMGTLSRIIYGAGERRLYNMEGVPINSVIPGLDFLEDGFSELGNSNVTSIVIPFTPVHIPEDANSVTLNISWNLDGIISHYEGPTDDANDDVFVLKNGWWNGLYIDAIVN
jgi:hypothetical protein